VHRLDADATRRLHELAGLDGEPPALAGLLPRGIAVLAAALGGLGLIFWIAANWETLGRFGRFALLQGVFLAACAGALWRPAARQPLLLLALLAIGGLFAYFGQTCQTGADPWQLFALWAGLALPLAVAVRSDVLWAPWALVAMSAVSQWVHAHTGHRWRAEPHDLQAHAIGWAACSAAIGRVSSRGATCAGWPPCCGLDTGAPLASDELRIELTPKDGRWVLVSDAWFFKEGEVARWEPAKCGEFRVAPDGKALLVGLRGAALNPL
jgi:hypothetical protein